MVIELRRTLFAFATFFLVTALGLVLNRTFPRGREAPLPPWRLLLVAASVVSLGLLLVTLIDMAK